MELGLPEIHKEAIQQMKAHAVIQDDEFAVSFSIFLEGDELQLRGVDG